jgi:SHS2 domain-containing protein
MSPWELFEHTADLGLRVRAGDLDTLFRDAAEGLFAMVVEQVPSEPNAREIELAVAGEALDYLLFDWLSELLYLFDTEHVLLRDFDVKVEPDGVRARARAVPLDPARQRLLHEIKAITYHRLRVEQVEDGYVADIIVDV